jgi:hypothetical protein
VAWVALAGLAPVAVLVKPALRVHPEPPQPQPIPTAALVAADKRAEPVVRAARAARAVPAARAATAPWPLPEREAVAAGVAPQARAALAGWAGPVTQAPTESPLAQTASSAVPEPVAAPVVTVARSD